MFRFSRLGGAGATGSLLALRFTGILSPANKYDENKIQEEKIVKVDSADERIARVKKIFVLDEYDNYSREGNAIWQSSCTGFVIGVCYGGFIKSRIAYVNFFQNNQAEIYATSQEARSKLQHEIVMAFMKGGFSWGWRIALFTGIYVLTSTCISVYRGKSSVLEYSIGGMAAGSLYKLSHGLRGIYVGSVLGLILGTITGSITLLILKLGNITMEDVRQAQHDMAVFRTQKFREAKIKALNEDQKNKYSDQLKLRDQRVKIEIEKPENSP